MAFWPRKTSRMPGANELVRGDLVTIAGGTREFARKPRPAILLQTPRLFGEGIPVPVCPVTSVAVDAPLLRIPLPADAATGLRVPSWAAIDCSTVSGRAALASISAHRRSNPADDRPRAPRLPGHRRRSGVTIPHISAATYGPGTFVNTGKLIQVQRLHAACNWRGGCGKKARPLRRRCPPGRPGRDHPRPHRSRIATLGVGRASTRGCPIAPYRLRFHGYWRGYGR